MDGISIPLSGLTAQKTRLAVAAENIANMQSENYTPKEAVLTSQGGGVTAHVQSRPPLAGGLPPMVHLEEEVMTMLTAKIAYKANIDVLKTAREMEASLLDSLA